MKRLLLVALLGALVVGATGCDLSPPAATVDGVTISQSTLNAALTSTINDADAQCATEIQGGLTASPVGVGTEADGTTPNAANASFAASELESLVLQQLEVQALQTRGVAVTRADLAAAKTDYESQLQSQLNSAASQQSTPAGCALSATTAVAKQLPAGYLQSRAAALADQEMFEVAVGHVNVTRSGLQAYYNSHLTDVTQECLNLVVADTQSAAQSLHDQIAGGLSFPAAAVAAEADKNGPTNGQLACEFPAQLQQQVGVTPAATIAALATGQLSAPISFTTQGSAGTATTVYIVVQIRQRQRVPLATLAGQIRQVILSQHASVVSTALNALVNRAQVSIDARYGTWNAKRGVSVPTPPLPAFVPNAKANVPATALAPTPGLNITPSAG